MIGIDMVYIPRIAEAMARREEKFLEKILSGDDIKNLKNRTPEHIAGIFAAKEAMGKALGEGIFSTGLKHLHVGKNNEGKPYGFYKNTYFHLSISHEKDYAISIAQVVSKHYPYETFSLDPQWVRLLPKMKRDDHKGSRGKAAIIGGSLGMYGSVDLATRALLRSGTGLAYALLPEESVASFALRAMEVIVKNRGDLSLLDDMKAVAIGPGMGRDEKSFDLFKKVYSTESKPLVVDADGLFHLSHYNKRRDHMILTPHEGEMARLIRRDVKWVHENRVEAAKMCQSLYGGGVVLKGNDTVVTDGERVYLNPTGNAGMATAGSGDVLTGIITSFLAQGLDYFHAAGLGVYVHGMSGDIGVLHKSRHGLIASDLIEYLPDVFLLMEKFEGHLSY